MRMHFRVSWLIAIAAFAGCSREGAAPQQAAQPPQTEAADKEVLVASRPSGATILLKGAPVGETPMKLLVRGDTNLVFEKEGYVRQALLITPTSDPNLVVDLVPSTEEPVEVAAAEPVPDEEAAQKDTVSTAKKKTGQGSGAKTAVEPEKEPEPIAQPEPEPVAEPKPAAPTPKSKVYTTMRQIKDDLAKGIITKDDYRKWQAEIRKKRAVELEAAERDLRAGLLTKAEYNQKVRDIKLKFEG